MDNREHEDATTDRTTDREETDGRESGSSGRDDDPAGKLRGGSPAGDRRDASPPGERRDNPSGASVVDLARQPVVTAWTTYLTLLLALIAVGFGLFGIFSDAIGNGVVDTADGLTGLESTVEAAVSIPLTGTPYLAIVLAVFVGAFLGWRLERDRSTTYVTAGIGTGVATFVFWTLTALFGTIPLEVSIDISSLFVNAILAGITAGLVAVGGVWATRTRAPNALEVQERPRRTRRTRDARTSRDGRANSDTRESSVTRAGSDGREAREHDETRETRVSNDTQPGHDTQTGRDTRDED
ncbi:ABC transporter permease [Natronorubrum daqingense]|uniref:Uncharacterized protein n=1 Tax=Natronorubrum daqingense TaxID=588898 RepID=A0A1N7FB27_9EURY|nr:hypothetical protein [Natronorubrum daqingense]SIR97561.1 hypothetical protein SAMN05421809_3159 [Natronorubrum daqingense]